MNRKTRRLIFYFLTLTFLLAGPLLVGYSLGYIFDFSTASFEQTGGIFIKVKTPRVAVFLDGSAAGETGLLTGSAFLTDVRQGAHLVRLEKEGFRPWSKTVPVKSATVTEFRTILLIPRNLEIATSSKGEELARSRATSTPGEGVTLNTKSQLTAGAGRTARVILENVHSFTADGTDIFFVDKNGFLARMASDSGVIATIGRPGFVLDGGPMRFIAGQRYLVIIDPSGGLFLYEKGAGILTAAASEVTDVSFDDAEQKLLLRRAQSIAALWLADNPYQPLQQKGIVEEIISGTVLIHDARWLYGTNAHIIWRTQDGLYFAETDLRGGLNKTELLSGITDELITHPSFPDTIFWRKGKTLYKTEL